MYGFECVTMERRENYVMTPKVYYCTKRMPELLGWMHLKRLKIVSGLVMGMKCLLSRPGKILETAMLMGDVVIHSEDLLVKYIMYRKYILWLSRII